jgi:23S rRNA (adenine2503-C2)-methyltransferase
MPPADARPGAPPDLRPQARDLDLDALERALAPHLAARPRLLAEVIEAALHRDGAIGRDEVFSRAGLGKRRAAAAEAAMSLDACLHLERRVESERDGGARLVLAVERLGRREAIEAVTIRRRDDLTLCLSSQAGCGLACAFCATGALGFRANLTVGEIVEQHAWALKTAGRRITDVVFMGMGEPLLNYDAVVAAAYRLTSTAGPQISRRRIVISTAGVAPRIRQYARERHPFPLFFSISSAIPEKRRRLMPIEAVYPLPELRDAIVEYHLSGPRPDRVTLQYVAIPGENMGEEDIDALAEFIDGLPSIVDIIPFNAIAGSFRPPSWSEVKDFTTGLRRLKTPVKIRYSSGKAVAAGCGQLAADRIAAAAPAGHMISPAGIFSDLWKRTS